MVALEEVVVATEEASEEVVEGSVEVEVVTGEVVEASEVAGEVTEEVVEVSEVAEVSCLARFNTHFD